MCECGCLAASRDFDFILQQLLIAQPCSCTLPVSLKLELLLVSSVIFHRGVKLVASKMIGLDDVPSTSSDSVASSSCEENIHELYD